MKTDEFKNSYENMKLLPNLTGLRFLLAFLVVIFHIPQFCQNRGFPYFNNLSVFNKGEEAVYMFFSLSGFLIIRQLYVEKSVNFSVNLKKFFLRRILRIFPLYYLVLTFGLIYYRLILPFFGFDYENNYDLVYGILLSYTFFSNIFASYSPGGIIEVLWSIGIEEQFYLLIAPLIFIIPFKKIKQFLLIFTIFFFLIYFSELIKFLRNYNILFFYFSFSGLCSIMSLNKRINLHSFKYLLFFIFIIYFTTPIFRNNLTDFYYHLISMILFGLTLYILSEKPIKLLENKWLIYLGKISFGIYMYHAIMMQFVGFIFLKSNLHLKISNLNSIIIFNLLVFVSTIIIAHLSFKYFESYFLNLKEKLILNRKQKNFL
jgi:peptidoglycan/LPS O-acetylase OafA/YrhL